MCGARNADLSLPALLLCDIANRESEMDMHGTELRLRSRSTSSAFFLHLGSSPQMSELYFHVPASPPAQLSVAKRYGSDPPTHTHTHTPPPSRLRSVSSEAHAHGTAARAVFPRDWRARPSSAIARPRRRPAGQRRNLAALDQLARARLLRPLQESVAELGRSVALAHGAHLVGEHSGVDGDGLVEHGQHRLLDLGARVVEMYE